MRSLFRRLTSFLGLALCASLAFAQSPDSLFVKTGFSFGILPSVAYDADLGFQYGALANLYWYGNGDRYPRYDHSLYVECSRYLAGTMLCRAYYDSPEALSGVSDNMRLTADVTWFRDLTCDFYGFNGKKSVYCSSWTDDEDPDYRSRVFYAMHRNMTRGMLTVRKDIPEKHLFWQAGLSLFHMSLGGVHRSELRHSVPDEPTLFELYKSWGVVRPDEARGGTDAMLRVSVGVDTRDSESFPSRGVWSEAIVGFCPNFLTSHDKGFARLTLYHRQYVSLGSPNLVFAYRAIWQHRFAGRVPFYLLPHISTATLTSATNQGLGGAKTMRGVVRNRIVADGSALANVELRWRFAKFNLLGQEWALGSNLFADLGIATQQYEADLSRVPDQARSLLFRSGSDCLHTSLGIGLKLHMNANFIVSVDYGRATRSDDGKQGFYVMMNYLF